MSAAAAVMRGSSGNNSSNINTANATADSSESNLAVNTTVNGDLKKVAIYGHICEYEDTLARLVQSVDNYKPDLQLARQLIGVDTKLYGAIDQFSQYDEIDSRLNSLDSQFKELDNTTRDILESLNECHDQLNKLPTLEQVEFEMNTILEQRNKINSNELLDYATRLSKFSKIPPTFDRSSIGPNNFIWPAEDSLRKGMLALASLHSDEITKLKREQEQKHEQEHDNSNKPSLIEEQAQQQQISKHEHETERRQSFVFGENTNSNVNNSDEGNDKEKSDNEDDMDLDLDLFNPDDF